MCSGQVVCCFLLSAMTPATTWPGYCYVCRHHCQFRWVLWHWPGEICHWTPPDSRKTVLLLQDPISTAITFPSPFKYASILKLWKCQDWSLIMVSQALEGTKETVVFYKIYSVEFFPLSTHNSLSLKTPTQGTRANPCYSQNHLPPRTRPSLYVRLPHSSSGLLSQDEAWPSANTNMAVHWHAWTVSVPVMDVAYAQAEMPFPQVR